MTNFKQLIATAALAAGLATPALAVTFEGALTQGSTVVTDFGATGLISFDIDFGNFQPAVVEYRIDGGDMPAPIDFSAVFRNLAGSGIAGFTIALDRGTFASVGSVTRLFAGAAQVVNGGAFATITFNTPEFLDVEIGNALGTTPGAANWTIGGLNVGDRVNLTVTPLPVPEPGVWVLMALGLGALALRRGRFERS
jgi:hypothetical protein